MCQIFRKIGVLTAPLGLDGAKISVGLKVEFVKRWQVDTHWDGMLLVY